MTVLVSIDGEIVEKNRATIPVFDRGFLYGDSVYEVIRTYGAKPFAMTAHLDRLERSADMLGIELPVSLDAIGSRIHELLHRVSNRESYIRVIVTRGEGEIELDPASARNPHLVIIAKPLRAISEDLVSKGASIHLVQSGRCRTGAVPGGSKTGNYLANIMALGRARKLDHHEAVFVQAGGSIAEGASSNIFIVGNGFVRTPCLETGILPGITRGLIIQRCKSLHLQVMETDMKPADLIEADEVFLTSTLREILPVVQVDEHVIGDGSPGKVTMEIRQAFLSNARQCS